MTLNSAAGPQVVTLTGQGVAASGTLTPLAGFGTIQIGQSSAAQTSTLTNTGSGALAITSIRFTNNTANFSETNNCPATLAPAGACQILVIFTPTRAGVSTSTLQVTASGVNGGENPGQRGGVKADQ